MGNITLAFAHKGKIGQTYIPMKKNTSISYQNNTTIKIDWVTNKPLYSVVF